jgi:hypothetical protein
VGEGQDSADQSRLRSSDSDSSSGSGSGHGRRRSRLRGEEKRKKEKKEKEKKEKKEKKAKKEKKSGADGRETAVDRCACKTTLPVAVTGQTSSFPAVRVERSDSLSTLEGAGADSDATV